MQEASQRCLLYPCTHHSGWPEEPKETSTLDHEPLYLNLSTCLVGHNEKSPPLPFISDPSLPGPAEFLDHNPGLCYSTFLLAWVCAPFLWFPLALTRALYVQMSSSQLLLLNWNEVPVSFPLLQLIFLRSRVSFLGWLVILMKIKIKTIVRGNVLEWIPGIK